MAATGIFIDLAGGELSVMRKQTDKITGEDRTISVMLLSYWSPEINKAHRLTPST